MGQLEEVLQLLSKMPAELIADAAVAVAENPGIGLGRGRGV